MKKALLLIVILSISVISTACINNLAVQELNAKAKTYMDNGDTENAIARLKSSVDLDPTIFESYYNLAVAYTRAEDYLNAVDAYEHAIKLKPEIADSYYSLAVCEENLANDIIQGEVKVLEDGTYKKLSETELDELSEAKENKTFKLDEQANNAVKSLMEDAVKNYEAYVKMAQTGEDVENAKAEIEAINTRLEDFDAEN